jgi:hypothetical protein
VPSWATSKHQLEKGTTLTVLEVVEAAPYAFVGDASFSFFTNHSVHQSQLRELITFDMFSFNYDSGRDGANLNTYVLQFLDGDNVKVDCEDCYVYFRGGFGIEYDGDNQGVKFAKGKTAKCSYAG